MASILIQIAEIDWTLDALHLGAALAAKQGMTLILLRLIPVPNPSLLGEPFNLNLSEDERYLLKEAQKLAKSYRLEYSLQPMQYLSRFEALSQAAKSLEAKTVFAPLSKWTFPLLQKFELWRLQTALSPCELHTLKAVRQQETVPAIP